MRPASHRAAFPHAREAVVALGIDIGTTNTKAVLVAISEDTDTGSDTGSGPGAVAELAVRSFPTPGSAAGILAGLEDAIRAVVHAGGAQPTVVGIASMAETGVPLTADGSPLRGLIRWNGQDGALGTEILRNHLGADELFAATGVPLAPKVPLAMWAAFRTRDPALWGRMARWAGAADFVALALTGHLVTDHTLAGRTMAYRLPPAGQPLPPSFDAELLGLVGLTAAQLPRVAGPGEPAGAITRDAGARFGLTAGIPVFIAGHDHAVGAWAAGVRAPGEVANSVGTAEALVRIRGGNADRHAVGQAGMSLTRSVDGRHESILAGTSHAGSLIADWFEGTLGGVDRDAVFVEVSAGGTEPGELMVLPYPSGRQAPAPDPGATMEILDAHGHPADPAQYSAAELTGGLLAGLALHLRWMATEQARLAGAGHPDTIRVLGGAGAANQAWLSYKARVIPASLETVTAREPVASGAALLAAIRGGMVDSNIRLSSSPVPRPVPRHQFGADYDATYATFVAAAAGATAGKGNQ